MSAFHRRRPGAPPEDVGGLPGFEKFLNAMAKRRHPQHREVVDWYGGRFEPDDIAGDTINDRMPNSRAADPSEKLPSQKASTTATDRNPANPRPTPDAYTLPRQ